MIEFARQYHRVSIVDPSATIHRKASVRNSVIGSNVEIFGHVSDSVIFSGGLEKIENRPTIRRNVVGPGIKVMNSILVSGELRKGQCPTEINGRIIYETVHGGLAFDPI